MSATDTASNSNRADLMRFEELGYVIITREGGNVYNIKHLFIVWKGARIGVGDQVNGIKEIKVAPSFLRFVMICKKKSISAESEQIKRS